MKTRGLIPETVKQMETKTNETPQPPINEVCRTCGSNPPTDIVSSEGEMAMIVGSNPIDLGDEPFLVDECHGGSSPSLPQRVVILGPVFQEERTLQGVRRALNGIGEPVCAELPWTPCGEDGGSKCKVLICRVAGDLGDVYEATVLVRVNRARLAVAEVWRAARVAAGANRYVRVSH